MGWKLVRDNVPQFCEGNGISGQFRRAPDPQAALRRKLFEEAGEYVEHLHPSELYDLRDVLLALIALRDPDGEHEQRHAGKVAAVGLFTQFTEWNPAPASAGLNNQGDIATDGRLRLHRHRQPGRQAHAGAVVTVRARGP